MPKKIFAAVIILSFLPFSSFAAQKAAAPGPLTFKEFTRKVLLYYPKLKQGDADVNMAIARKLEAVSGFLPRLQGSVSATRGDDPVYVFGSLLRQEAFTSGDFALSRINTPRPHTDYSASIEGQIPLFDAFQTISRVRSARLRIDSARFDESFTRMEAFLVASEAYLRAVAVEKTLAVVTQVAEASEGDIKQAEELKDKGVILGADFFAAKVMLGNIRQLKNQLTREKQAAHIVLSILMGEDPLTVFEIQDYPDKDAKEDKPLQDWLEEAYRSRPDLAALEKTIQAQGIEVWRERSSGLPRVDAYGEARQDTDRLSSDGGKNYVVGVRAQMPLFDPSYSSRLRISKETLRKLEYDKTLLKDMIARDLASEFARYQAGKDNLPLTREALEDARQAVELMLPLYREGRKSIADLLEIRNSYLNAARGFYALATDTKASWTRLFYLSGQLDETRMADAADKIGG